MKALRNLLVSSAVMCALGAMAVPAKRTAYTFTQPDGTKVTLTHAGDEFNKYFLTDDGKVVVGSVNNGFYFAAVDNATGRLTPSSTLAADVATRTPEQKKYAASMSQTGISAAMEVNASKSRLARRTSNRSLAPSRANGAYDQQGIGLFPGASYPRTGSPKGLIILVQYTDVKFQLGDNANDYFTRLVKQTGFSDYGGTGCAEEYFSFNSNGQFTPDFEVYGPVTLPNKRSYYGANDYWGDDVAPEQMVIDGCKLLDDQINFKDFDTDGDGYVDNVFVFYAGRGEASSDEDESVWPHQWEISSANKSLTLDGVKIDRYACSNEWEGTRPDGIGTFVHEFSHVMGLPDLYHTQDSYATYTPGAWSVLDYGPYNNDGCTPPAYSIFERNAMGWADITVLDATPASLELEHVMTSNKGYLIPTADTNEFFLLENRQRAGWDKYIPGHGMLIWHVDYDSSIWTGNKVNNTQSHQYVDIEEANGNPNSGSNSAMAGWAFPGASGIYTQFTDDTTPSMRTWAGKKLNMPITNIAEAGGVITFDICGGKPVIDAPVALQPSIISANSFEASWQPVDGAVDYLLSVFTSGETITRTDVNDFGDGSSAVSPEDWETSTTSTYTSSGNYGAASPSYKLAKAGDYFATPFYDYPIEKLTFWAKGMSQKANTVSVYAYDKDKKETLIATLSSWNMNKGETVTVEPDVEAYKLKLVYNKENTGNLAIDDVTVTYSSIGSKILDNYNDRSTNGATSLKIENLPASPSGYSFSVVAVNAEGKRSARSNVVEVKPSSSIIDIDADIDNLPALYYNLQGQPVANPRRGQLYIRRQGSKAEKIIY